MSYSLHPNLDNGFSKGDPNFAGGKLHCLCSSNPVEVTLDSNVLHNHACGCSLCWKPKGALFSIVAVIPKEKLSVTANGSKLQIVNPAATIQRYACKDCGAHLYGRIEKDHAFKGLDFVHVELSDDKGWQEPQFAGFVPSLAEQGFPESKLDEVRNKLKSVGLESYDALSPPLMQALSDFAAKNKA
ncbi:putative glutathione-dependent formaldehyde-activating enzyme [Exophiala mesophila]|uniref:Putative glutathione-dependent formaldehyde-activating enzyme n=1 Tax=Exophiala mesophila TaxID=212818 RepID=A0A438NK81_EXOME|nr:putative glutathione-dependent formaldehyde-activating enzyme [Exophiala mesophila]